MILTGFELFPCLLIHQCVDRFDLISCQNAQMFCLTELDVPPGGNPYDISKVCSGFLNFYAFVIHVLVYNTILTLTSAPDARNVRDL